jgi:hypothetical protein
VYREMVDWQHYRKECRRKKGKEKIKIQITEKKRED